MESDSVSSEDMPRGITESALIRILGQENYKKDVGIQQDKGEIGLQDNYTPSKTEDMEGRTQMEHEGININSILVR